MPFLYQVRSYLASFGIIGHISFQNKKAGQKGFLLRVMDHQLYVEKAHADTGLQAGDQILGLDGSDLEQVASLHKDYFISKNPPKDTTENGRIWSLSPKESPCFEKG